MGKTYIKLDGNLVPACIKPAGPSPKEEETKAVTPNFSRGNVVVTPTSGKVMSQVTINKDGNLIADNIKKDVKMHGITGTYVGETPSYDGGLAGDTINITESGMQGHRLNIEYLDSSGQYYSGWFNPTSLNSVIWIRLNGVSYAGFLDETLNISGATESELRGGKIVTSPITINAHSYTCLTGDTLITMSDNTTKRIDELQVGDCILAYDFETQSLVTDEVSYTDSQMNKTALEYDVWTFDDGTIIKTVHRHEFYNVELESMEYMDMWEIGQHTYKIDGTTPKLIKHENIKEKINHYTLFGKRPYSSYFANNLLSGNRQSRGKKIILGDKL